MAPRSMASRYQLVYFIVRQIPPGRVATYGQIARLMGRPRDARQVGYALAACPDGLAIPWHRVVNARGEISRRSQAGYESFQRVLLEEEGVVFDARGRIALARFQWRTQSERQEST